MLPEEDKEMMRQGFDTQLSEEEIERLYSFAEKNAMEELAGVDIEELKRRERLFPIYKPDMKLSLDALLACAFARSQKMMRFIHPKYDANKELFFTKAQESDHFQSRFITGSRIVTRMNAIKALGLIVAAKTDKDLDTELFQASERAWKRMSNIFKSFHGVNMPIGMALEATNVFDASEDNVLHDAVAVFLYFCDKYKINPEMDDPMYRHAMAAVVDKDVAFLRPFSEILHEAVEEEGTGKDLDELMHITLQVCGNAHSVAELGKNLPIEEPEFGMFQILWDFAQLDNVPMSAYENEQFSKREIQDIFYVMRMHMARGDFQAEDINKYFIMGLMIRSFSRLYHEAVGVIERYAGIVRESERYRELDRKIAALTSKANEQTKLLEQRQEKLNEAQKEIDRAKRHEYEQAEELEAAKERVAVLESLMAEDDAAADDTLHEKLAVYTTAQIDTVRHAKAVVFGGPPNWQAEVKKAAPGFTCVSVESKGFDSKIIDRADVVVFKTDYMSHAQWYRVLKRAKSRGRKIVYCRNNIDILLRKVAGVLN